MIFNFNTVGFCSSILSETLSNTTIVYSNGSGVEGSYLNFSCMPRLSPSQVMASICTSSGQWQPHPNSLECTGIQLAT